ncbi:hypothetical protein EVAR_58814_1 [Eumeta japonica]|uniref:Uncharacterized protein n=1 Tax=Eumeta variegata TaxID=151549 RepID=A0A4C1YH72_EUMVA|nr:hypothetical protein EVAR_58814_1 [Eumeta japonica]
MYYRIAAVHADASLTQVGERQMSSAVERGGRLCLFVARSALSLALQALNGTPQSENSEETERGENIRVEDQSYTVDALILSNQTLSIFAKPLKCVWFGVIMVKNHIQSVDQFPPFLFNFLLESLELLAVEIRIDDFAGGKSL